MSRTFRNALAALPNVILTPHIGAQTWGQRARGARIAEDAVLSFLGLSGKQQTTSPQIVLADGIRSRESPER